MSSDDRDGEADAPPHPRQTSDLVGHAPAERTLLDAYRGGRMPHAWLLGGEPGIGKATLAYRLARFVLAHPHPQAAAVQAAASLAVEPGHPTFRRIASEGHPDLFVLQRTASETTGKLRNFIAVDDVRRATGFFGLTPGEGGWRVCVVDTADELQGPAANALLKILEEPPSRALFVLVSHAPGRLLATIRSRCRRLALRPLSDADVASVAAAMTSRPAGDADIQAAAGLAGGSVAAALSLLEGDGLALRRRIAGMLAALPAVDQAALHGLGEQIAGTDPAPLAAFVDAVREWLSARLGEDGALPARLARAAQAWEKLGRAARDTEIYNLERKPLVFDVFGWLAEAARP